MTSPATSTSAYPPIEDYALLSDCAACALVSKAGAIDWCCMPAMSDDPCFGRLLDWQRAGHCTICPEGDIAKVERIYENGSLVLQTTFTTPHGSATLSDFFAMPEENTRHHSTYLGRRLRCTAGEMRWRVEINPRFDFGEILPAHDMRRHGDQAIHMLYGSNQGLMVACDLPLQWSAERNGLAGTTTLRQGDVLRLSLRFVAPEDLDARASQQPDRPADVEQALSHTLSWWHQWACQTGCPSQVDDQTRRSALILKGLSFDRTGAIAAAATTSLPESLEGERNWDYRYSWIRDSALAVRALHLLGFEQEAGAFTNFTERAAAGSAAQLQIMYGLDGRRRLPEISLDWLEGYRGSRPVRVGNQAARQTQHDIYGSLLEVASVWHSAERPIEPTYWAFLVDVVDTAIARWQEPDYGIWEFRDEPKHFVHSKVMCWAAVDRGLALAQRHALKAPTARWREAAQAMRDEIDRRGYDSERGIYLQVYDEPHLDAALLLLPHFDYVAASDPRMVRTTDEIRRRLERNGLLLRYIRQDGLDEPEGAFLPCTFWLAECLALQGRREEAWRSYRRALSCANDLGLFSEEYDIKAGHMLGNFPQALTHLAQITARLALIE